jgi:TatD DNase family protein
VSSGRLVDFHCHLDLFPNGELFKACDREEIFTLAVTPPPRAWSENQRLAKQTKFVRAALNAKLIS